SINRVDDFIPVIGFCPARYSFSESEGELGFEQSMRKTPARDGGRALEYIIFEDRTVGWLRNPEQSLHLLRSSTDLPTRNLVRPLGSHELLDSVAFFKRSRLIVWRKRAEESTRSAGFEDGPSSTVQSSNHETSQCSKIARF